MQDAALNLVRPLFATLPGVSAPPPFGGSARSIVVNVKPDRLARLQHVAGRNRLGDCRGEHDQPVGQHADRRQISDGAGEFGRARTSRTWRAVPIRTGSLSRRCSCATSATVEDGSDIVTSYALVNGRRTVYIPVTKRADASTLVGGESASRRTCRSSRACCPGRREGEL